MSLSIILPIFKLEKSHLSLLNYYLDVTQNFDVVFILIVKNYSLDFNLSSYHKRIKLIVENDNGIYDAMNIGVENTKCKYLYFLGDDDLLMPNFSSIFNCIGNKSYDIILFNVLYGDNNIFKNKPSKLNLLMKNFVHQGIIYRRNFFLKHLNKYELKYKIFADYHANLVLFSKTSNILYVDKTLCRYNDTGISSRSSDEVFLNDYPLIIKNNYSAFLYCLALLKKYLRFLLPYKFRRYLESFFH